MVSAFLFLHLLFEYMFFPFIMVDRVSTVKTSEIIQPSNVSLLFSNSGQQYVPKQTQQYFIIINLMSP